MPSVGETRDLGSIHFLEGGVGRRNPYEHECEISKPSLYIFVKKCDPPLEAVKFIVTHLFVVSNSC